MNVTRPNGKRLRPICLLTPSEAEAKALDGSVTGRVSVARTAQGAHLYVEDVFGSCLPSVLDIFGRQGVVLLPVRCLAEHFCM
ncbi:hypothetical protein HZ326_28941 [Fusarium oxysporum f. sp. albedinis]|nr:hypothetical protein HZ326_28941 [Fusarium oxysporum f. sp. albedinis]